jgi:helicase
MLGRAGRPKYDKEGYGIIIAKDDVQIDDLMERYLRSESEPIMSKLGSEDALRMHTLALIATMDIGSEDELYSFYERTFFSHQKDINDMERSIERALEFLFDNDLIERWNGKLKATDFGIRTSETYIDPMSAVIIRKALESGEINEFGYLHTISLTPDMYPLYPKRSESYIYSLAEEAETPIEPWDVPESAYVSAVKTALVLRDWIDEVPENTITERYGIWPGDLASRVELAEWLLTATRELSRLFRPEDTHYIDVLARRMHHGVKEDVLSLMEIKGVGRVRGRALHKAGYRHISDLRKASIEELMKVEGIGESIARKIKEQVGD